MFQLQLHGVVSGFDNLPLRHRQLVLDHFLFFFLLVLEVSDGLVFPLYSLLQAVHLLC